VAELKRRQAGVTMAPGRGPARPKGETTGQWLTWWAEVYMPGKVAGSTLKQYRQVVKDWVAPYVGDVELAKLAPADIVDMMRALEAKGLSANTQGKARKTLAHALKVGQRFDKVTRNVAMLTDPPKDAGAKVDDTLTPAEVGAVLAAADDRLGALAVVVLSVGLRQGEAIGLRWDDVDLGPGTLAVHGTKTRSSERRVALPPFAVAALKAHHRRQLAERMAAKYWDDDGLVFTSTIGTGLDRWQVMRWWHDLLDRAGVERRRFHATRHTAATSMLNAGVPLEVVSKTLGHAGLAITADVYAKVRPELQRTAADAMERLYGGAK
jgi:integrase